MIHGKQINSMWFSSTINIKKITFVDSKNSGRKIIHINRKNGWYCNARKKDRGKRRRKRRFTHS